MMKALQRFVACKVFDEIPESVMFLVDGVFELNSFFFLGFM